MKYQPYVTTASRIPWKASLHSMTDIMDDWVFANRTVLTVAEIVAQLPERAVYKSCQAFWRVLTHLSK